MKIRLRRNLPSDFVRGESMISCNQFFVCCSNSGTGGGGAGACMAMHGPLASEQKVFFFFAWLVYLEMGIPNRALPIVDNKPSNLHETSMLELTNLKLI